MRKLLVINADDFGYCEERNRGILECYNQSCVTSVSLMVNAVGTQDAVSMIKKYNISAGLHLNLTEGLPVGKREYKTLLTKDGFFHAWDDFRKQSSGGKLSTEEIKEEIQAQIDRFTELVGHAPQHIDGHQHVHIIPEVMETFASLLQSNGIKVTRIPAEDGIEKHAWNFEWLQTGMALVVKEAKDAKLLFQKYNLCASDLYFGLKLMGSDFASEMNVSNVKDGISDTFKFCTQGAKEQEVVTCEWMVHPGYKNKDAGGCGGGADDFSKSQDRENEMAVLRHPGLKAFFDKEGIELVDFYTMQKEMSGK